MIRLNVERRYLDVFAGRLYRVTDGNLQPLVKFVFRADKPFRYKGKPCNLDGFYPLKYANFDIEGFQFRPLVNYRTMTFRFLDMDYPEPLLKDTIYLCTEKGKWEEKCRTLFSKCEYDMEISGYDKRMELPLNESVLVNVPDFENEERELDDDEEDFF